MYRSWRAFLRDAHHNRLLLIPAALYAVRPARGSCGPWAAALACWLPPFICAPHVVFSPQA